MKKLRRYTYRIAHNSTANGHGELILVANDCLCNAHMTCRLKFLFSKHIRLLIPSITTIKLQKKSKIN